MSSFLRRIYIFFAIYIKTFQSTIKIKKNYKKPRAKLLPNIETKCFFRNCTLSENAGSIIILYICQGLVLQKNLKICIVFLKKRKKTLNETWYLIGKIFCRHFQTAWDNLKLFIMYSLLKYSQFSGVFNNNFTQNWKVSEKIYNFTI